MFRSHVGDNCPNCYKCVNVAGVRRLASERDKGRARWRTFSARLSKTSWMTRRPSALFRIEGALSFSLHSVSSAHGIWYMPRSPDAAPPQPAPSLPTASRGPSLPPKRSKGSLPAACSSAADAAPVSVKGAPKPGGGAAAAAKEGPVLPPEVQKLADDLMRLMQESGMGKHAGFVLATSKSPGPSSYQCGHSGTAMSR